MSIPPFLHSEGLDINDLKTLQDIGKIIIFKKGEKIFTQNEPSTHIVIVMQGFVKLFKMTKNKNVMVRAISPMQLIGESVPTEKNRHSLSAQFMTEGMIISIDYKQLEQLSGWSPNIALSIFNLVNKSQLHLFQEIENRRMFTSIQKIALFFLNYESLLPELKYKEIASILFLSNETFSRGIRKLKDEKFIVIENRKVKLNEQMIRKSLL
jgi:CRP-like cAMP-binding protein